MASAVQPADRAVPLKLARTLCQTESRVWIRVVLAICVGIYVGVFTSVLAVAQGTPDPPSTAKTLPGEDTLPGNAARPTTLPDEGQLPGSQTATDDALPGEDQIPGQAGPARRAVQDASGPISGKAPILRLAYPGHTGIVRTLDISDGGRTLVSAGEDKVVHVWRRTDIGNTGWLHLRTIRWPVTRGPRGVIYRARLKGDLVAFGGFGAFGGKGEIRIVDAANGDLNRTLVDNENGHLANVLGLDWSPGKELQLASVDMNGRLVTWKSDQTGQWRPKPWVKDDAVTYNENIAAALRLAERRAFVPLSFVGPNYLVVPRFVGPAAEPKGFANWHLDRIDLRSEQTTPTRLNQLDHIRHVRDLCATDDGRVLASCDWGGSIGIWTFAADGSITSSQKFKPSAPPVFVDLDDGGTRLLVGTELVGKKPNLAAKLQIWDIQATPPKLLSERSMADNVRTGVIDLRRRQAIVSQGIQVQVYDFDPQGRFFDQPPKVLRVPAQPVQKVAFAKAPGNLTVAMGWNRDAAGKVILEGVFDLSDSKLLGRAPIDPQDYLDTQRTAVRWQVGSIPTPNGYRYQLYEGDQPRGFLPLQTQRHGVPSTVCTLPVPARGNEDPDAKRDTGAVVVGTSGEYGIYVYRANAADPPELLRHFRDHSGTITSLSSSVDGNYLVSGSGDATVSVWNLQDIFSASKSVNRWGADFDIEGTQLIATNVREDGPLYFRGVRGGDRLLSIDWANDKGELFVESDPQKIQQRLLDLPFDFLVHFRFTRLNRFGPDFQSLPAWRPLATLFVDQSREWAFWTPAGYYDASFNGHQLFGWQLNNDVDQDVDYFRAAQFQNQLERGDVMRLLLDAGSLPAAMRQTVTQIGPPPAEGAIVNQIQNKPTIRLIQPDLKQVIRGDRLTVRAEIEVPLGATLVDPKAFVSGVPAVRRTVVDNAADAGPGTLTYEWDFRLPSDTNLQLEVLAATQAEALARVIVDLQHVPGDGPRAKPRLHVLAIGASQYRDPQIQSLDFAAKAAGDVSELFRTLSEPIYRTSADELVNSDATRPLWRVFAQNAAAELGDTVSPDDLVIMYLCGHGLRDRRTNQWYFVTADARYSDLMNDQYGDCIAFSDLAALAKLPCRKLAILDSCHSGAVQPLMQRDDLKSALRFLQDDVVLTITASEGDEEAAEQRETRLGRFTAALVDALRGEAGEIDGNRQSVSLTEVIDYVTRRVTQESERDGMPQHPTASPRYLLRTLQLPLTSR